MKSTPTQIAKRMARIAKEREAAEARVDELKDEYAELEAQLIAHFERSGIQNMNVDGRTLYLRREVWPKYVDQPGVRDELKRLLKRHKRGDLVTETVNHHRLAAFVREHIPEDGAVPELPKWLSGVLTFSIRPRISAVKSRGKR